MTDASMSLRLRFLSRDGLDDDLGAFIELLQDAVDGGASLGFLAPMPHDTARRYWLSIRDEIASGSRLLLAAYANGRLAGTGQLFLPVLPSAHHRAEVQKLLVHSSVQRLGLGRRLLLALHDAARAQQRSLIVLGTRSGEPPEAFYQRVGYRLAGVIPGHTAGADGERYDSSWLYLDLSQPVSRPTSELLAA
ncbi:MAG TPA: GNAT family N-acetyltransferase [Albitalea sp.]|uniref:GNAT family N-acetyltransferase n=1 Tax=Piscinibacter sp. TaxID=1903157 RepID=UPI002ED57AA3